MNEKKKVSIDFLESTYQRVVNNAKRAQVSNSKIINTLVDVFLDLPADIQQSISTYCQKCYNEDLSMADMLTGFLRQEKLISASRYRQISEFFGMDNSDLLPNMKKIYLKQGYVIFPSDWIILSDVCGKPEQCMYAGVVECRNAKKYRIPHFIFFSDYRNSADYPADFVDKVYAKCIVADPDIKQYYNMQQSLPDLSRSDEEGQELIRAWMDAPEFGIFSLAEKGIPPYWNVSDPNYIPPYGAMIVRDI